MELCSLTLHPEIASEDDYGEIIFICGSSFLNSLKSIIFVEINYLLIWDHSCLILTKWFDTSLSVKDGTCGHGGAKLNSWSIPDHSRTADAIKKCLSSAVSVCPTSLHFTTCLWHLIKIFYESLSWHSDTMKINTKNIRAVVLFGKTKWQLYRFFREPIEKCAHNRSLCSNKMICCILQI